MAARTKTIAAAPPLRRSARNLVIKEDKSPLRIKKEEEEEEETEARLAAPTTKKKAPSSTTTKRQAPTTTPPRKTKRIKAEPLSSPSPKKTTNTTTTKKTKDSTLESRKLASYSITTATNTSPFPSFPHPTPSACHLAHKILTRLHGARARPTTPIKTAPTNRSGCGDSPSVLDALVRTILSQNTSDANSTRAKLSLDAEYASGPSCPPSSEPYYAAIASSPLPRLEKAIQCGGLAGIKSKVIMTILSQTKERHGRYSLDHLFSASDDEAMRELLAMKGVGPKTASCVLLFCLGRESFAVDTHVYRITGWLGWRPGGGGGGGGGSSSCGREEAQAHLDAKVPGELKYGLHVLFVKHGKVCEECKAGGGGGGGGKGKKGGGGCELRRAFRRGPEGDEGVLLSMMELEDDGNGNVEGETKAEEGLDDEIKKEEEDM